MTDPIADMLTRIRNGQAVGHRTVSVPHSELKLAVAEILKREGYLERVEKRSKKTKNKKAKKILELTLAYTNDAPAISDIKRVSKPGQRIYRGWKDIAPVRQGYGRAIISTPKGLLTDREARRAKVGGEVLLKVW